MTDDEKALIMLSPITDDHLPECTQVVADCGHDCWIGPSMKVFVAERDAAGLETFTRCMPCAGGVQAIIAASNEGVLRSAPGIQEEVATALRSDQDAEILFRLLGIRE